MNKKEQAVFDERVKSISDVLGQQMSALNAVELAKQLVRGVDGGRELDEFSNFGDWINNRFSPQTIWLNSDDYARGITRALPQALIFASADFGSSKQRDLGQLWTDTARGLLGEIAVQRFFKSKLDMEIEQDTTLHEGLDDYISTDIKFVKEASGKRPTKINTSIKTGKFNARWLDEYSAPKIDQIDAFIFVRLGTPKEHFVAYLKDISFLKTKLFPKAIELGELTADSSSALWDSIPQFEPIPAYVSGFLMREGLNFPIHSVTPELTGNKDYRGKGKDTRKIFINKGVGIFTRNNLYSLPEFQSLDPENKIKVIIGGINKEVDNKGHFYANTGSFKYSIDDWQAFAEKL